MEYSLTQEAQNFTGHTPRQGWPSEATVAESLLCGHAAPVPGPNIGPPQALGTAGHRKLLTAW